jgi:hypothetical protein
MKNNDLVLGKLPQGLEGDGLEGWVWESAAPPTPTSTPPPHPLQAPVIVYQVSFTHTSIPRPSPPPHLPPPTQISPNLCIKLRCHCLLILAADAQ